MDTFAQIIGFLSEHKKLLFTVLGGPLIVIFFSELWKLLKKADNGGSSVAAKSMTAGNVAGGNLTVNYNIYIASEEELEKRVVKQEEDQGKSLPQENKEKIETCFIPGINELERGKNLLQYGQEAKAKNHLEKAINLFICAADALPCYETFYNLAEAYYDYCDYDNAKENFQKAIQYDSTQPGGYNGLGAMYCITGDYSNAEKYLKEALTRAGKLTDKQARLGWQTNSLSNLGNVYYHTGRMDEAREYYQQALKIDRETENKQGEAEDLNNLGVIYRNTGNIEQALEHYQQALSIHREVENKSGQANALMNVGNVYKDMGRMDEALEQYNQAIDIFRKIENKLGEASTLGNLGLVYYQTKRMDEAIEHHQQALDIQREIGDKMGEAKALGNLGLVYHNTGQIEQAREHYLLARAIFKEIGAVHLVQQVDENLAKLAEK